MEKLRIMQLSDLHITQHRNLLKPMITAINSEKVDLVVVTGDLIQEPSKELYSQASEDLNKITHKVLVIPGEYDSSDEWEEYFGERYRAVDLWNYHIDLLDTSFMGHRFASGWGEHIEEADPIQYKWFLDQLHKDDQYHLVFSHHPVLLQEKECSLITNNIRGFYSGHLHEPRKFYFTYVKPLRENFNSGVINNPLNFHGNMGYVIIAITDNDEIITQPKMLGLKRTAW